LLLGSISVESLEEAFVLTREGYEQIRRELEEMVSVKKPEVVNRIREARHLGDPAESFEYEDAKRIHSMLDARIAELKAILAHANVVEPEANGGSVGIGSKVIVKDLEDDVEEEFTIVGSAESSPSEGRISHECSVGSELMGKKSGDKVLVETPGGIVRLKVLSVQ
jgi:transcription elongation factor GreA